MTVKAKATTPKQPKVQQPKVAMLDTSASAEFSSIEDILQASKVHIWTDAKLGRMLKRYMNHLSKTAKTKQNGECLSCDTPFMIEDTNIMNRYGLIVHRRCNPSTWYKFKARNNRINKALASHNKAVKRLIS